MGVDFADLNRDGYDEIFVADMLSRDHQKRHTQENDHKSVVLPIGQIDNRPSYARNTLFLNHGDGDYSEIAYFSGVSASDWSWCPIFLDVDLDGYEDILISTGFERDVQDIDIAGYLEKVRQEKNLPDLEALNQRKMFPRLDTPNVAFRNKGDLTFAEVGRAWGFDLHGVSQGMALADLDNDGDLDIVINNLNGAAAILRNDSPAPRESLRRIAAAPFRLLMTMSRSPSLSKSASAIPCETPWRSKPHARPTSANVKSPLFLKATLGVSNLGNILR